MTWPKVIDSTWKRRKVLKLRTGAEPLETLEVYSSTVTADSDGRRLIHAGTIMAEITSGTGDGKYGPYDPDAADGRQTLGVSASYVTLVGHDVTLGDKAVEGLWAQCVFNYSEILDVNSVSTGDLSALKTAFPNADWK